MASRRIFSVGKRNVLAESQDFAGSARGPGRQDDSGADAQLRKDRARLLAYGGIIFVYTTREFWAIGRKSTAKQKNPPLFIY